MSGPAATLTIVSGSSNPLENGRPNANDRNEPTSLGWTELGCLTHLHRRLQKVQLSTTNDLASLLESTEASATSIPVEIS
jgi:hypothetical protein